MESSEIISYIPHFGGQHMRKESELRKHTDDEEHPERFLWILDLWQEVWSEAEGESYFGRLVEVGFQYMPI